MEQKYLEVLPQDVQAAVLVSEKLIGSAFEVREQVASDNIQGWPNSFPACITSATDDGATHILIAFPPGQSFPPHLVVHEAIHAIRKLTFTLPELVAYDTTNIAIDREAQRIDNDIEHLYIVPIEIAYMPLARLHWEGVYAEVMAELEESRAAARKYRGAALRLRQSVLMHWLVASNILPGWSGLSEMRQMLEDHGWQTDADALVNSVQATHASKLECIVTVLEALGHDANHYRIRYRVVEDREIWICPVDRASFPPTPQSVTTGNS